MTCLFTHDDLDGVGCAIVARLAFPDDLVVRYCSYKTINSEINCFLDQLQVPVKIIISDISVNEETAKRLDGYDVAMYDHHPITVLRPWMTVDNSGEECGTSLLAKALLPDASAAITSFVDSIRQFDTWKYKKGTDSFPERLDALHVLLGHRGFEAMVLQSLADDELFSIPHFFDMAVTHYFEERERYFEKKEKNMVTTDFNGYKTAVVFAERDISLMAEYVFQKHPNMDIVAVCYLPTGVSFRTRRDDINLTEICRQRGGGGHQKAAAFYLKRDTVGRAVDVILG